ncbi:cytochrome c biogenesis protein CcsA [bacterium]|nr:cytochrome c biogenesis protein CcsA [bacterium]
MNAVLVNTAFACLLAALGLSAAGRLTRRGMLEYFGNVALGIGWIALTVLLVSRWRAGGFAPLSNQYESLVSLVWCILLLHFALSAGQTVSGISFWTALLSLLFLGIASLLDPAVRPLVPALQSNWLLFHVATTLLAYAALSLATLSSVIYLIRFRPDGPDLAGVDAFTFRAITLGFILLTVGIILGAVWANEAWGTYWSWDPKETWSLITWFVYAIAVHLRRLHKWRGKRFAWLAVAGFACVLFTYFGVNYLLAGLHSYA